MSEPTIEHLMALVPKGETRLFTHTRQPERSGRFLSVHGGYDGSHASIDWLNTPDFEASPSTATYKFPAVSVTTLDRPKLVADGFADNLLDFYRWGGQVRFISPRLCALIEDHDPGSLDKIPATLRTRDAILQYYSVLPARSLHAIDADSTDVLISDQYIADQWLRSISFPNGITFKHISDSILSFSDFYDHNWYWSRILIDKFGEAGMRGIYTRSLDGEIGTIVDRI